MIYEFAVDPSIVPTWCQRGLGHDYFVEQFGLGTPRIISQFPTWWERLVWREFRQSSHRTNRNRGLRLDSVLKRVNDSAIARTAHHWDPHKTWLENTELHHRIEPFEAILSATNPRSHPRVICASSGLSDSPLWQRDRDKVVRRSVRETGNLLSPMLRIANTILFIDPHFSTKPRYLQPFESYFKTIVSRNSGDQLSGTADLDLPEIEIHRSFDHRNGTNPFKDISRSELNRILPRQLNLTVRVLCRIGQGQRLHNRYVLTDVGGLHFGHGLDVDTSGSRDDRDDVSLLGKEQYWERWKQYANGAHVFRTVDEMRIKGGP